MKKILLIIVCISFLIGAGQILAQPGVSYHKADKKAVPKLSEGKNLIFGAGFSGTDDSFTFGIIADRHGGNPLVGWPYFEQAIRDMNVLHPDFVIMPGDLIDGYIRQAGPEGAAVDFNEQFDLFARFANRLEMPLYFAAGNHDISNWDMLAPFVERFGRLWYSFDYRGGSQQKPHSFYLGHTHHTGLVKVEGDTLHLSILELGTAHRMDQVSKTQKSPLRIETLRSLRSGQNEYLAEIAATIINPQSREIRATFYLQGLTAQGWRSDRGQRSSRVVAAGDSAVFRSVLSVSDPLVCYPPLLNITADDNGLILVDHLDEVPVFKNDDYRKITKWLSAAPFPGKPMSYTSAPFDPRRALPAMFKDFGPEQGLWNAQQVYEEDIGWKQITAGEKGRVELDRVYGNLVSAVAYATAFLESPDECMTYLRFTVNDYGRIWLNQESVGEDIVFSEDGRVIFPVWLHKGGNRILVKTANWSNKWYFEFEIADPGQTLKFE